jgi:hypothetical protein
MPNRFSRKKPATAKKIRRRFSRLDIGKAESGGTGCG